jgi:hypothetical protein
MDRLHKKDVWETVGANCIRPMVEDQRKLNYISHTLGLYQQKIEHDKVFS